MPRYMVERSFPDCLNVPTNADGAAAMLDIVKANSEKGVTWVHSYVSADKQHTYCIYDAPNPEAIRQVASSNGLPVDTITEVSVLAPYFYH
jgi:predicted amidohydrolase YtcJ